MTERNERTSARVAKIAAKVMQWNPKPPPEKMEYALAWYVGLTWADIRALAASCLTQTADKPKRKSRVCKESSLLAFGAAMLKPKRKLGRRKS